jgi:hypothetical protein
VQRQAHDESSAVDVLDRDRPVTALDLLTDECEPEAAAVAVACHLRREPVAEDLLADRRVDPRSGVMNRDDELAAFDVQRDVDVPAPRVGRRFERVVDQVADHRDETADVVDLRRQLGRVHVERDAVLAGDSCLAEQQRSEDRVADALDERRCKLLVEKRRAVDLPHRVVVPSELDQPTDHVQTVLEFVLLCA